jgi:hypothetical protein
MVSDSAGSARPGPGGSAFWWRLTDNLFRRLVWFLIPVVALTGLGVSQALNSVDLYSSTGTISASSNPLLPEQPVSGVNIGFWETPAAATSRIIGERLQTDSFLVEVAERAGLGEAVDAGLLPLGIIRANVGTWASGNSILNVSAQWADPQTSHDLVSAIIVEYEEFLATSLASDAAEAETYYQAQVERLSDERDAANARLQQYVSTLDELGPDEEYSITVTLEIERLSGEVSKIEERISSAQDQVDDAKVKQTQLVTEAARSFTVIDPPNLPAAPESDLIGQVISVAAFALMGLAIAAGALLLTTALDRSVSSPAEVMAIRGITQVATVPNVRLVSGGNRRKARRSYVGRGRAA